MEHSILLEATHSASDTSKSLFQGSSSKALITELQRVLFELGFRSELRFDKYQADGNYGPATANAVSAFAKKNHHNSDGSSVSDQLAKLMLQRHHFLPEMYLLWSIHSSDLRTRKYISRGTRMSIRAVQSLLNEVGYSEQLNFPKYGADGLYGKSTRNAVIAYAKDNNIQSDGDLLSRPLIDLMLNNINAFYGSHWSDLAENNLPADRSPLVLFAGSRFIGNPCRADFKFIPSLQKINQYAEDANVFVYVTSSFRTSTNVRGAIVKPAIRSNHLAGHAIDMNLVYGHEKIANSKYLAKFPAVAEPVKDFISSIVKDPDLRWGGQFSTPDTVHIDDGLNQDKTSWERRYKAMQKAVQLGD